ncbi:MAG: FAD-binding protein [Deltaproteobacteria bacterium]|nr:FAD-binding protein [Deltaproteobacteria bacterium]
MGSEAANWNHSVDVLVVGSGGGAMTAAIRAHDLGANTLVIEKTDMYGGTTAMGGGVIWVPDSHLMAELNLKDDKEKGFEYIKYLSRGEVPDERIRAYVEKAPEMLRWVHDKTRLRFTSLDIYPDYYPAAPGYMPGGRSHDPCAFDGKLLGDDIMNLRELHPQTLIFGRLTMETMEFRTVFQKSKGWVGLMMKVALQYLFDIRQRFRSKRSRRLTLGNSVAGSLRMSMIDRDIPFWLNCPMKELIKEGDRVTGVVAEKDGKQIHIKAEKGVILGAGGFEKNQEMREEYLPKPTRARWSTGSPGNTGDIIRAGKAIGADLGFMDDAWWGPTVVVPGEDFGRMMIVEKSLPGCLFVDKKGRRFTDEAAPYIEVVKDMYKRQDEGTECVPAYMIFGATYRKKYPVGPVFPGENQPNAFVPKALWDSYIYKADSVRELAEKMDIDPAGLEQSVSNMNGYAESGKDEEYDKGGTEYDRFYGDEACGYPNPCLSPIDAPYYGVRVYAGELGTKGGLMANEKSMVLDTSGNTIKGLYAIGNCSAALMGPTYAGAGSTVGPAMTFGYIAAEDAMTASE